MGKCILEVANLSKAFKTDQETLQAVNDVSFHVNEGEVYGLIGLSGAGKSTLVRCLNLLERPDSGQIFFDGKDLTAMSPKELQAARREIAMIFQHFNLFSQKTVYDNIAFPLRLQKKTSAEIEKRVLELLDFVELSDKVSTYPGELSGGQKQRVAIARALSSSPRLLLSDEGTSALDPKTSQTILDLLRRCVDDLHLSVLMITHQMELAHRICDRIAVMENGLIVEEKSVEDLFLQPQHPASAALVRSFSGDESLSELCAVVESDVYRLGFRSNEVAVPLISDLSRRLGISVNLLAGNIRRLRDEPYGWLAVSFPDCKPEEVEEALRYLEEHRVLVRKYEYSAAEKEARHE